MSISSNLREATEAWIADDLDPAAAHELQALLDRAEHDEAAADELADRLRGTLEFGTAGLRGVIAAGPNRYNRAVAARATAGLLAYLAAELPGARERGIVIGYDGRRLSRETADDAAALITGAGFRAFVFPHVAPTPLTAFATVAQGAAAGIMITASHNPPEYNGYKVYWENGAQIIPPHDAGIAAAIAAIPSLRALPRLREAEAREQGLLIELGPEVENRYLAGVRALLPHPEVPRRISIAYTALHGVGDRLCRRALATAGFTRVHSVAEQAEPDGEFPTVSFPNPEEKGAMDLVLALAAREKADLVLANDPDADRLAVAARAPDGSYVRFSGNEVGALLAHYLLGEGSKEGERVVMCSIVSSPMLAELARIHGAHFEYTLTGFKWLANRAIELLQERGARFIMAFEEALGYTAGTLVRDKDGISTAVLIAEFAAVAASRGRTLIDELETAWRTYGLYLSHQVSRTMPGADGAARIQRIMAAVRQNPPARFGDYEVLALQDIDAGTRTPTGGTPTPITLPRSNVLLFELAGAHRIMLRPSGTEPKIKYYFDVREVLREGEPVASGRARGQATMDALVSAFLAAVEEAA